MTGEMKQQIGGKTVYAERYGIEPSVAVQAPGRVEVLGNHTDYNGGYVLTAALDRTVTIHGEKMDEAFVTLYSVLMDDEVRFSIDNLERDEEHSWADYVKGVLDELQKENITIGGFRAVIAGDIPMGAGVSSSAALETAAALFVQAIYQYQMEKMSLAKLCRRAENFFVGAPCGILDQFSVAFGERDSILYLDCDTLEYQVLPMKEPVPRIVLCNTHVKHKVVEGEYKVRRRQCEAAAQIMGERLGRPVRFLRDVTAIEFLDLEDVLDDVLRCRARHIMYENRRVQHGVSALQLDNIKYLGELMIQSHESSRDNFENSCEELDVLVEEAVKIPGCYGSKLTGGGFGGCTVNLVEADRADEFAKTIEEKYTDRTGKSCETTICSIGEGAKIL